MGTIAIIAAMPEEVAEVKNKMTDTKTEQYFGKDFTCGLLSGKECVLAESGVGKVNASGVTQFIIDKYSPEAIINVGSAGAVEPNVRLGDIVVSSSCVQHDFDITAFGREKGFITGVGKNIEADQRLIDIIESATRPQSGDYNVFKGIIASGDCFVSTAEKKAEIHNEFGALCVEMEGAAVAQICKTRSVPFVVIRSISDTLEGDITLTFEEFLVLSSKRCAAALEKAVRLIKF